MPFKIYLNSCRERLAYETLLNISENEFYLARCTSYILKLIAKYFSSVAIYRTNKCHHARTKGYAWYGDDIIREVGREGGELGGKHNRGLVA